MKLETKFNIGDEVYEVKRSYGQNVSFSEKLKVVEINVTFAKSLYTDQYEKNVYYTIIYEDKHKKEFNENNICSKDEMKEMELKWLDDEISRLQETIGRANKRKEELLNGE